MKIKTYDLSKVSHIPWDEYEFCRNNNFSKNRKSDIPGAESSMKVWLEECLDNAKGNLFIAFNEKNMVGWAISYKAWDNNTEFQIYVPPRQRRKGIGTLILETACNLVGKVRVFSHEVSEPFYRLHGLSHKGNISGKKIKKKI